MTVAAAHLLSTGFPAGRWIKTSGIISPEKWGNRPGGECFTSPGEVGISTRLMVALH